MRSHVAMAAFVLVASALVSAQHGGGHSFAGSGHGGIGMRSGSAGHMSGHSSPGMRFSGSATHAFTRSQSFHQPRFSQGLNHFHSGRIHARGFRNKCFGFGCRSRFGYPWWYAGAFDPYWWWDSGSSYDEDRERQIGLANEMNAQSLEEQRMHQQGEQDVFARSDPPPARPTESSAVPATILVFRDQRKRAVQNYAIVGQTLWSFAPQRTEKIPLPDLDLPATTKANDDRGVDFRVPSANEGQ